MTAYYVDSVGGDDSDGTTWAKAYTTYATATSGKAAGDVFYVSSGHAETSSSSTTITLPTSSYKDPVIFISCDDTSGEPPTTYTAGGSIAVTGGVSDLFVGQGNATSYAIFIGLSFIASDDLFVTNGDHFLAFYACTFQITGTSSANQMWLCQSDSSSYYEDCVFRFGGTGQSFFLGDGSGVRIVNGSLHASGAAVTTIFGVPTGSSEIEIRGFDATSAAAGVNFALATLATTQGQQTVRAYGVKMPSSWSGTMWSGTITMHSHYYEGYVVDDADTLSQIYIDTAAGTVRTETTTVHTSSYSAELTSANEAAVASASPVKFKLAAFYSTASPTVKVNLTSDSTLTDQECWIRVMGPDATTAPLQVFASSLDADKFLGSGTTLTSGSGWTSAKTNSYEISQSITSQAGIHEVWLYFAPASAKVVYADPEPVLS